MRRPWTQREIETLTKLYPNETAKNISLVIDRSVSSIYRYAQILGLSKSDEFKASPKSGRTTGRQGGTTRFKQGHTPWNKGKPRSAGLHPNSRRTQFKKGEMSGAAQHNYVPIGSTRITRDGALERKVTDDPNLYPARRWVPVARLVWEAANGPIPEKHIVRFKDGIRRTNESEITLDKLECISLAENMRRNTLHRYPKEIAHLIQLKGAINRQINKRSNPNEKHK